MTYILNIIHSACNREILVIAKVKLLIHRYFVALTETQINKIGIHDEHSHNSGILRA